MHTFKRGDSVFPKWSQRLPAFRVVVPGAIMITIVDDWGNRDIMHYADIVLQDPNRTYEQPRYEAVG